MGFDTGHLWGFDTTGGPTDPDTLPRVHCGHGGAGPIEPGTARERLHAYLKNSGDGDAAAKIDTILAHPLFNAAGDIENLSTRALWSRAARLGLVRV